MPLTPVSRASGLPNSEPLSLRIYSNAERNSLVPIRYSRRSNTRRTALAVQRFMRKARNSFSCAKNMVSRVFFDSLEECTVFISTNEVSPRSQKSLYSLLLKIDRSLICVLWHFLGLKEAFRFRSMFRAVKSPRSI